MLETRAGRARASLPQRRAPAPPHAQVRELFHWRAHEGCISSLDYIDKHGMVLSASADGRVKLWAVTAEGGALAGADLPVRPPRAPPRAAPACAPACGHRTHQRRS